MSWWGNSLEKAVGFSNYATTALKTAQKKIDKVLEIPIIENVDNQESSSESTKYEEENTQPYSDSPVKLLGSRERSSESRDFSDIDLTSSPPVGIPEMLELTESRCGDWSTDDSLTASQFERFHPTTQVLPEIRGPVISSESDIMLTGQRNSHLSMSSDCTVVLASKLARQTAASSNDTEDSEELGTGSTNSMVQSGSMSISEQQAVDSPTIMTQQQLESSSLSPACDKGKGVQVATDEAELPEDEGGQSKEEVDSNTTSSDIELVTSCGGASDNVTRGPPPVSTGLPHQQSGPFIPSYNRSTSGSSMSICKIDNNCSSIGEGVGGEDQEHLWQHQLEDHEQQLTEMTARLEMRETKMIQLSRENIDLRETINNLTRQIEQMSENQDLESTDISNLTREFTTRLNDAERRLQLATKERDQLRKTLSELQTSESQRIELVIKEKEGQVASLLIEGEKLAQDQLKANTTIKKLRGLSKEREAEIGGLGTKVLKLEAEVTHLKKVLDNKEDNERKHVDGINQLTKAVEKLERDNLQLSNNLEVEQTRTQSLESGMRKGGGQVAELQRKLTEREKEWSQLETRCQSLEGRGDLAAEYRCQLEEGSQQVTSLQQRLQLVNCQFSDREQEYHSRIAYLQERLAKMEQRQDEMNEAASNATKPILRQLEAFQNVCNTHTANWEQVENSLNNRLREAQQKLQVAEESFQSSREQLMSQEVVISSLREEKLRLMNQFKQEYKAHQSVIDEKLVVESHLQQLQSEQGKQKERLSSRVLQLEQELMESLHCLELEKQAVLRVSQRLSIMHQQQQVERLERSRRTSAASTITDIDPEDSVSVLHVDHHHSQPLHPPELQSRDNTINAEELTHSVYESLRSQQGVAATFENLESLLKQRDGQVARLNRELTAVVASRDSVLEELEELQRSHDRVRDRVGALEPLGERYDALLQMYGEKMDEVTELRLDLTELRDVYRSHIDMLSKTKDPL